MTRDAAIQPPAQTADKPTSASKAGLLSNNPLVLICTLLILIAAVQTWIVTAGFNGWHQYSADYCQLADAFLHGQLNLPTGPPPALLALPDPYDPQANLHLRHHDAVLFDGKYYLYWGPVPALLVAAVCWPLRISSPHFGDEFLVLPFMFGTVLMATTLMVQAKIKLFPNQPMIRLAVPVLSLGLGTPVLFTLARSAVYEAAILGGQFFLLAGICSAWFALSPPHPRKLLLLLAGICWTLSAGSRVSLAPALAGVGSLTLWQLWKTARSQNRRPDSLAILSLIAPPLAGAVLFAWYNHARFGSVFEFGNHFQLAADKEFFSLGHLIPNALSYLLDPPNLNRYFPYLWPVGCPPPLSNFFPSSGNLIFEPLVGLAWSQPFLVFAAFSFLTPRKLSPQTPRAWLILSLTAALALGMAPILAMNGSTMRYLMDFVPSLAILAALGYWHVLGQLDQRPRYARALELTCATLVIAQTVMAILLALTGYYAHFGNFNRPLYNGMRYLFSLCRSDKTPFR